jgi:hypothetical protein
MFWVLVDFNLRWVYRSKPFRRLNEVVGEFRGNIGFLNLLSLNLSCTQLIVDGTKFAVVRFRVQKVLRGRWSFAVWWCLILENWQERTHSPVKEGVDRPIAVIAVTAVMIKSRDCYFKVLVECFSRRGGVAKI